LGAASFSEISVTSYHCIWRRISKDLNFQKAEEIRSSGVFLITNEINVHNAESGSQGK
jgi:hypothetical protein